MLEHMLDTLWPVGIEVSGELVADIQLHGFVEAQHAGSIGLILDHEFFRFDVGVTIDQCQIQMIYAPCATACRGSVIDQLQCS